MTNIQAGTDSRIIRWLTYMMFMMFAMTTDAVGVIIPEVMKDFDLSMTAAGMLHYGPMLSGSPRDTDRTALSLNAIAS